MATGRAIQKASRRAALMHASAQLFAERGFNAVSTVELGEAVGMSGPALYNYFPSKEALLSELLVDVSTRLLTGCLQIVGEERNAALTLDRLIDFHVDFAITEPDIIVVQSRELLLLPAESSHTVRRLQREYLREWEQVLTATLPELSSAEAQTRLLAAFGLLNSTPHSGRPGSAHDRARSGALSRTRAARVLTAMARAALLAPVGDPPVGDPSVGDPPSAADSETPGR